MILKQNFLNPLSDSLIWQHLSAHQNLSKFFKFSDCKRATEPLRARHGSLRTEPLRGRHGSLRTETLRARHGSLRTEYPRSKLFSPTQVQFRRKQIFKTGGQNSRRETAFEEVKTGKTLFSQ